jgi:hypothetical protein
MRFSYTGKDDHSSSEFPKEEGGGGQYPQRRSGGFRLTLAVSAVVPPVILGLGPSMGRRSLLLSVTSGARAA